MIRAGPKSNDEYPYKTEEQERDVEGKEAHVRMEQRRK